MYKLINWNISINLFNDISHDTGNPELALESKTPTTCPFYIVGNYNIWPPGLQKEIMVFLDIIQITHYYCMSYAEWLLPHIPIHKDVTTTLYTAHLWSGIGKFSQPVCSDSYIFFRLWTDWIKLCQHMTYSVGLVLLFFVCLFCDKRYCGKTGTIPVPIVISGVCNVLPFVSSPCPNSCLDAIDKGR